MINPAAIEAEQESAARPRRRDPIRIAVRGHEFNVFCAPAEREALLQAAEEVARRIERLRDKLQVADGERAALMAAVQIAFDAKRGAQGGDNKAAAAQINATIVRIRRRVDGALGDDGSVPREPGGIT